MNIKSLLIGSAAALAVVSGAQAADAVVAAEPEPMEYVRVCDAYGTGFFYIPGTETCLKIGGKVRFEKAYAKYSGRDPITGIKNKGYYSWFTRAEVSFEAKNDSEWGTVYSWILLRSNTTNNNGAGFDARYYMGINGFEVGRHDTPGARFHDYTTATIYDGYYEDTWNRQYISYTANWDGFSAMVALTNDLQDGVNYNYLTDTDGDGVVDALVRNQNRADNGRTFMPDLTAGLKGTFGDYSAGVLVNYDESDESFNVRKWVRGDIGMFGFTVMGLYSNSVGNDFFHYDGFSAIVGLQAKVTDTVSINKMVQWFDDDHWSVAANVKWAVAEGFVATLEGRYSNGGWVEGLDAPVSGINDRSVKSVMLRLDRNF
jgi:hypothetical protein